MDRKQPAPREDGEIREGGQRGRVRNHAGRLRGGHLAVGQPVYVFPDWANRHLREPCVIADVDAPVARGAVARLWLVACTDGREIVVGADRVVGLQRFFAEDVTAHLCAHDPCRACCALARGVNECAVRHDPPMRLTGAWRSLADGHTVPPLPVWIYDVLGVAPPQTPPPSKGAPPVAPTVVAEAQGWSLYHSLDSPTGCVTRPRTRPARLRRLRPRPHQVPRRHVQQNQGSSS